MQRADTGFIGSLFTGLTDDPFHFFLLLFQHFLDMRRVDTSIEHQLGERALGNLTPHRIETRDGDCFWGVVDDDIDAGCLFEGVNIAPVAPDDASFHLIGWQGNDRSGHLANMLGGKPLDGSRDDLACLAITFFPGFRLHLADDARHIVARVFFNLSQQDAAGFFQAQLRNPL